MMATIYGTAVFLLVDRHPEGPTQSHLHDLHYFDRQLWKDWVKYIELAREKAHFFGGSERWITRIHWNVLLRAQREPFTLARQWLTVVARPKLKTLSNVRDDNLRQEL